MGGFVAPLLLNQLPMPLENDVIIPLVILAWYTTSYCGTFHFWTHNRFAQVILLVCVALFRTHTVMKITIDAAKVFLPRAIYPSCAVVGPIFVGTLLGSSALFFPQRSDGFQSVETETPWALQASFTTSTFTHLMLHDKTGFLGTTLRAFIGHWDKDTITLVIATMHIITIFLQTFVNAEANIFENLQVHSLLYFITGVQKPLRPVAKNKEFTWAMTNAIESAIHWWKVVICVLGPLYIFTLYIPPSQLRVGMDMLPAGQSQGRGIGHCTWLSEWRQCKPYRLSLHYTIPSQGQVTNGEYALLVHNQAGQIAWSQKGKIPALSFSQEVKEGQGQGGEVIYPELRASLDDTGVLRVIIGSSTTSISSSTGKQEQLLWASTSTCKKRSTSNNSNSAGVENGMITDSNLPRLVLNKLTGKPMVVCDREEQDILLL